VLVLGMGVSIGCRHCGVDCAHTVWIQGDLFLELLERGTL
jgi:predicted molibdopterin-dependent oxidoreductase YjgC